MKYIIAIPDGATDQLSAYPQGDTPLRCADSPTMDALADHGEAGWAQTVPDSLPPGSDVACLSIFGYDTTRIYTGRAPLEAANMGIDLGDRTAFRCNLVTIEDGVMKEFTAGHITTEEAADLIVSLNEQLGEDSIRFHTGVQYRHILTAPPDWNDVECTPPHDILDQEADKHLPQGLAALRVNNLMKRSRAVFADHPINRRRLAAGKPPATQIWLWGQGTKPQLTTYQQRFGLSGGVISAVDLIQGIGRLAGLEVIQVPGATGLMDTNYEGKAEAALRVLENHPLVLVHVESTDEMGHAGDAERKTQAIRDFDQRLLKILVDGLRGRGEEFRLLLLPDHPTPIALRTHVNEPVPFLLYDSRSAEKRSGEGYSEWGVRSRTQQTVVGHRLIELLLEKAVFADLLAM
ncbi:MAG: cofactor-independent phosphoglycerate mutase [Candidatus Omnitrophica bacterium]|nr:cofactor-independent phosphoglycerate mutase [Candidatus Omnitrophota bacterium]